MALAPQPAVAMTMKQGTLAALEATLVLSLESVSTGTFQVTGTWVGTITFELSNDEFANAYPAYFSSSAVGLTNITTVNGNFRFFGLAGYGRLRARMSAYTSGSALVTLSACLGNSTQVAAVTGLFQEGEAPSFQKPVLVGGVDPITGVARGVNVDSTGSIRWSTPARSLMEYSATKLTYVGTNEFAASINDATWQIKKLFYSGVDLTDVQVLIGAWSNRASLGWKPQGGD